MYTVIANWKMYLSLKESRDLAASVSGWWDKKDCPNVELVVCPSELAFHDVKQQIDGSEIGLGVQDMSLSHQLGAFTGQTAAQQILEAGASHVIIGHSEMRQFYNVTDEMVSQQLRSAIQHGLVPIVCIGETREERDQDKTDHIIIDQLKTIFLGIEKFPDKIYIAYEPRWAIGTGIPVEPAEAERVHDLIKHTMREFGDDLDDIAQVLYGGSVDADNIESFLSQPSVQGALIGGASARLESLQAIVDVLQDQVCTED